MSIIIGGQAYSGTVIGGVECLELVDGLNEGIDDGGPLATKKYLCEWANRYALANAMLGYTRSVGGQSGTIQFNNPRTYPESPNLYAQRISIEGRGKPFQGAAQLSFPFAAVVVNYGIMPWRVLGDPNAGIDPNTQFVYATQTIDMAAQLLPVPNSSLRLFNGHYLDDTPFTLRIPNATLVLTFHRVPFIPWHAIEVALEAPINDEPFLGIEPFYCYFEGGRTNEEFMSDGSVGHALTLTFKVRKYLKWDEVMDKDGTSGPQQVLYNGNPIYDSTDFNLLIPSNYFANGQP